MGGSRPEACLCPLEDVLDIISRKWTLLIIATIGNRGNIRFNEIVRSLPGLTPKILARRLKDLEAAGLVERRVYPETPPRVEYALTREGLELRKLIKPLIKWAASKAPHKYTGSPCIK